MPSYQELMQQIDNLAKQAEEQRKKEIADVVAEIKKKMADYGISIEDLGGRKRGRKAGKPSAGAKYRNAATGETWTGVGRKPNWINEALKQGKKLEDFLIK